MSAPLPDSAPPAAKVYHIYCDESRQTADRFMVLGGIIIDIADESAVTAGLAEFRRQQRMTAEMKWTKVSRGKLSEYMEFVDRLFLLLDAGQLAFHALLLDTHLVDHSRFNKGNKELGFYKFYYQLLLHSFGRRYARTNVPDRFLVFLDYRTTSYQLGTLKVVLNRGIKKRYQVVTAPFRNIEPRDSRTHDTLQLVDVVVGAIGFQKNGYHLMTGASPAKIELAGHIARRAKLPDLCNDTPFTRKTFTLWNFRLRE